MTVPELLLASHGTSSPASRAAVAGLVRSVAAALPQVRVHSCHLDVQRPDVATALAGVGDDSAAIVVPLLLTAGFPAHVDLTAAVADACVRIPASVTRALGPDVRLARILARRLAEAGLGERDSVVLAAAGSSDPRAVADCERMRRLLAAEIGNPVSLGFVSAAEPELRGAVLTARDDTAEGGRVFAATYLLTPGHFSDRVAAAGADGASAPLIDGANEPPADLVEIVVDRYHAQQGSWSTVITTR